MRIWWFNTHPIHIVTNSPNYFKFIEANIEFILFELISHAKRNRFNKRTYKKRATILIVVYKHYKLLSEYSKRHFYLDCSCTANFAIKNLFFNYDLFKWKYACSNCKEEGTRKRKTIVANLFTRDITSILDVLKSILYFLKTHEKCDNCDNHTIKSKLIFRNQVFIELFALPSRQKTVE